MKRGSYIEIRRVQARIANLINEINERSENIHSQEDVREIELLDAELCALRWVCYDNYRNDLFLADMIKNVICKYFDADLLTVSTSTRVTKYVQARQFISYFVRRYTDLRLWEIALMFNQDHASVCHSERVVIFEKDATKHTRKRFAEIQALVMPIIQEIKGVKLLGDD